MSENLRLLGEYSRAMEAGDEEAVFAFFAPEFTSHVRSSSTGAVRTARTGSA